MSNNDVECFTQVNEALNAAKEHLELAIKDSSKETLESMPFIEQAKLNVSVAYTINALLYVFLKTQGVSSKDRRQTQVKAELERVKEYLQKIKTTETLAKGKSLTLNTGAASRMINHSLSSDQVFQQAKDEKEAASVAKNSTESKSTNNDTSSTKKRSFATPPVAKNSKKRKTSSTKKKKRK